MVGERVNHPAKRYRDKMGLSRNRGAIGMTEQGLLLNGPDHQLETFSDEFIRNWKRGFLKTRRKRKGSIPVEKS